jgi:hypothetical protein
MIPELFIPIWGIPSISLEFTVVTAIRLPKWVSQELRSFLIRFHIFASPRSNFLIFLNPLCRNMHPLLFWFFKSVTTIHRMVDVILLQGAILLWQSFGRHQFHRLGRKYVWYYILPFSSQICTMLFLMFNFGFSNKLMGYTLFVLYTHFALLFTNMFGIIYSVCPSLHK